MTETKEDSFFPVSRTKGYENRVDAQGAAGGVMCVCVCVNVFM